jgi:hypothetical protein
MKKLNKTLKQLRLRYDYKKSAGQRPRAPARFLLEVKTWMPDHVRHDVFTAVVK